MSKKDIFFINIRSSFLVGFFYSLLFSILFELIINVYIKVSIAETLSILFIFASYISVIFFFYFSKFNKKLSTNG